MKLIKLVFSLALIATLALGGLYVAENRGLVPSGTFASVLQRAPKNINLAQVQSGIKTLSANPSSISQIASPAGAVLGSSISSVNIEKQEPPLTEKAFELGRYTYCKAVVNDYEARQTAK